MVAYHALNIVMFYPEAYRFGLFYFSPRVDAGEFVNQHIVFGVLFSYDNRKQGARDNALIQSTESGCSGVTAVHGSGVFLYLRRLGTLKFISK